MISKDLHDRVIHQEERGYPIGINQYICVLSNIFIRCQFVESILRDTLTSSDIPYRVTPELTLVFCLTFAVQFAVTAV
jgi:hypothetical protein